MAGGLAPRELIPAEHTSQSDPSGIGPTVGSWATGLAVSLHLRSKPVEPDKLPFTNLITELESRVSLLTPGEPVHARMLGWIAQAREWQIDPYRPTDPIFDIPAQRTEADDLHLEPFASADRLLSLEDVPENSGPFRWDQHNWPQYFFMGSDSIKLDTALVTQLMRDGRLETVLVRRHLGQTGRIHHLPGFGPYTNVPMTDVSFYKDATFDADAQNQRLFGKNAVVSINANQYGRMATELFYYLTGNGMSEDRARAMSRAQLLNRYVLQGLMQAAGYNQVFNPLQPKQNPVSRGLALARQALHNGYNNAQVVVLDEPKPMRFRFSRH